ncbi:MAG: acyltransferase [Pseudomonas sp.]|uniref:acyltransferase family protein n=1 Tax=Pseudomonas sp. TaxID=306 RepID=UPI00339469E5
MQSPPTPCVSSRASQPGATHYFHSLDCARGLAALAVVLWHWQHFFFNGALPGAFDRQQQPFYGALFLFYEKGWLAVDFFFGLSGFVFFWLYARPIRQRQISAGKFFWLRLSRLYPLHLASLLLVAGLQWALWNTQGGYFVYAFNDAYHFLLNLLFASAWGFERGFSFNAPIWSVSVEVLLYGIFFCVARWLPMRAPVALTLALIGLVLQDGSALIGRGLFAFFLGGGVYFAYHWLLAGGKQQQWARPLLAACLGAWLLALLEFEFSVLQPYLEPLCALAGNLPVERVTTIAVTGGLLPLTILTLAVNEHAGQGAWKRFAWLGEISYASYLLHFPLQLVFFAAFASLRPDRAAFYSPLLWCGFFATLVLLALFVHRRIERPLQHWLRRTRPARRAVTTPTD